MAFSTTGASGGNGLSSEINVTPLIDVLLVMLIIFMVIVPQMPHGLSSVLPSPASTGVADVISNHPVFVEVEPGLTTVRYVVDGADRRHRLGGCFSRRMRALISGLLRV